MAAAQNFALVFQGASGRSYSISGYTADTAGAICQFSPSSGAGAASGAFWRCPEAVTLTDFSMTTGTTQTSMVMSDSGAVRNGAILMFVPHLSTNSNRPKLNIPFAAGSLIGATTI
jgi:hypothetical protein